MKEKLKKGIPFLITIVTTLGASFILVVFLPRPRPLQIGTVDLSEVSDGSYIGVCQNKILLAIENALKGAKAPSNRK